MVGNESNVNDSTQEVVPEPNIASQEFMNIPSQEGVHKELVSRKIEPNVHFYNFKFVFSLL